MNTPSNILISKNINSLSDYKRNRFLELIEYLSLNEHTSGILLGGSISYKLEINKADIDLFCLLIDARAFEIGFVHDYNNLSDVDEIIYQGTFPWTERLYTIFYIDDMDFSIDLALIDVSKSKSFFWEPNGHILIDKHKIIEKCRKEQMVRTNYSWQPLLKKNPFTMSIISIKKIEKNLHRGHLWNAIDQVRNLRKYLMQVIRMYILNDNKFLGRVDRDIEDVLPKEFIEKFSKTIPNYDYKDIASKTIYLSDLAESLIEYIIGTHEEPLKKWVYKHLIHERQKLLKYIN